MTVTNWIEWLLSVIVTAANWLRSTTLLSVPLLYWFLAIFVMGVVIRAILYRA